MDSWDTYLLEGARDPKWNRAGRVHDWRNHVPEHIRAIWDTFTEEQRFALVKWADECASAEEWD